MQTSLERLRARREELEGEGGFTLIELLIVIVILGILAAIVVFAVSNLTTSSSQASCGSDYKTTLTAVEAYKAQLGAYPGGTITSGFVISATPTTPASGFPANVTGAGATAANQYTTSMTALLSSWGNGTNTFGPWLKTTPVNSGHYSIVVNSDGSGTVAVANGAGTIVPNGCSALTS